MDIPLKANNLASHYAACLLESLGASVAMAKNKTGVSNFQEDSLRDWARSGLMHLTGFDAQAPMLGPGCIASCASGALLAFKAIAGEVNTNMLSTLAFDGAQLLTERAAQLNFSRGGRVSANQSCHLMPTSDGWIALNLARESDWLSLAALFRISELPATWQQVAKQVALHSTDNLLAQGQLLGLAIASASAKASYAAQSNWYKQIDFKPVAVKFTEQQTIEQQIKKTPLVIDLSSLWAGPLCSHLLQLAGARIIKVESQQRPDGARHAKQSGYSDFFDLLNAGKSSVVLDLATNKGVQQLKQLISAADIVIEASRPRALQQLGIEAEAFLETGSATVWVSLTGYGRKEPQANWVAFGDDAAVAAGLCAQVGGAPIFCGDALADPLAGIHCALAALVFFRAGRRVLLDISLRGVGRYCMAYAGSNDLLHSDARIFQEAGKWRLSSADLNVNVSQPQLRVARAKAADFGADTSKVFNELHVQ